MGFLFYVDANYVFYKFYVLFFLCVGPAPLKNFAIFILEAGSVGKIFATSLWANSQLFTVTQGINSVLRVIDAFEN